MGEPVNDSNIAAVQDLVMTGNLAKLKPAQKMEYYNKLCLDLGLNSLTKPFQLLSFQGKEVLYATKDCTDQLRKINGVSITGLESKTIEGVYVVTAKAQDKHGRIDTATGALNISGMKGETLANALMKCETKAKRRVTLSISGLGFLDETEVDAMPGSTVSEVAPVQIENKSEQKKEEPEAPVNDKDLVIDAVMISNEKQQITPAKYGEIRTKFNSVKTITELNDLASVFAQYRATDTEASAMRREYAKAKARITEAKAV